MIYLKVDNFLINEFEDDLEENEKNKNGSTENMGP